VIEVEDGPEEPGEDEEFYAANFELLGQEDEDEEGGVISEDEAPLLISSEEATMSRCRTRTWVKTGPGCASNGSRWRSMVTSRPCIPCMTGSLQTPW
jgi:hypothetical protein